MSELNVTDSTASNQPKEKNIIQLFRTSKIVQYFVSLCLLISDVLLIAAAASPNWTTLIDVTNGRTINISPFSLIGKTSPNFDMCPSLNDSCNSQLEASRALLVLSILGGVGANIFAFGNGIFAQNKYVIPRMICIFVVIVFAIFGVVVNTVWTNFINNLCPSLADVFDNLYGQTFTRCNQQGQGSMQAGMDYVKASFSLAFIAAFFIAISSSTETEKEKAAEEKRAAEAKASKFHTSPLLGIISVVNIPQGSYIAGAASPEYTIPSSAPPPYASPAESKQGFYFNDNANVNPHLNPPVPVAASVGNNFCARCGTTFTDTEQIFCGGCGQKRQVNSNI